ncbi:hypothetical protein ACFVUH_14040 [Kitasatospora sp. NPDC058032]|uniref:hypothetical protein n=1 Tax=Kitasatospora sp. NPDC058032 TaxID=3346307 RepID=UPI0036D8B63D
MVNAVALLAGFAASWSRLSPLLDPGARRALVPILAEFRTVAGADEADARTLAARAVATVLDGLPADEAERLRADAQGARFSDASPDPRHDGYSAADLCLLVVDRNPMVGPLLGPIRERLLAAPAVVRPVWEEIDPRLVVLTGPDGRRRLPAFQFEAALMPWAVVLDVNAALRADADPWGAADWWLSGHSLFGAAPAELLGRGRDAELLGAARALAGLDGEG